jgi:hypothetical protein
LSVIAARPRARHRWRTFLRAGVFWVIVAGGAAALVREIDAVAITDLVALRTGVRLPEAVVVAATTLIPLPALLVAASAIFRTLRARGKGRATRALGAALRETLPPEFAVVEHYLPQDSGDGEVDLVIVGPTGVFAVEVRDEVGDVLCYQDTWYRRGSGAARRFEDSPSRIARWNASRVRNDVGAAGFVRTTVEPVIVFVRARMIENASSSVPVVCGADALLSHVISRDVQAASAQRAHAIVQALGGHRTLAVAS